MIHGLVKFEIRFDSGLDQIGTGLGSKLVSLGQAGSKRDRFHSRTGWIRMGQVRSDRVRF